MRSRTRMDTPSTTIGKYRCTRSISAKSKSLSRILKHGEKLRSGARSDIEGSSQNAEKLKPTAQGVRDRHDQRVQRRVLADDFLCHQTGDDRGGASCSHDRSQPNPDADSNRELQRSE